MAEGQIVIKKKKVVGGHAHHGGSWKVAYADFVTAMMAFFMVMWIMGLSDDTRTKIQGYFNDPLGFNKQSPRSRTVIALRGQPGGKSPRKQGTAPDQPGSGPGTNESELAQAKVAIDRLLETSDFKGLKEHIETQLGPDGLRIEFKEAAEPVFFESGSSVLRAQAQVLIGRVAPVLARLRCKMIFEGHTDAKAYSGKGYTNWDLSADRAKALYHAVLNHGVTDEFVSGVIPYADKRLRDSANPLDPSNRRVSILVPREMNKEIFGGEKNEPKPSLTKPVNLKPTAIDLTKSAR